MSEVARRNPETLSGPSRAETRPRRRSAASLPVFAALVSLLFVSVTAVPHASSLELSAEERQRQSEAGAQDFSVAAAAMSLSSARSSYGVTEPPPPPPPVTLSAPAVGRPDPGSAQAIAYDLVMAKGWSEAEYSCLVALWNRESGWNVYAHNASSGAYGIPQSLPGNKMASAGSDWQTNPRTQIVWGLGYIQGRYGTPCGAWASSQQRGWY